MAPEISGAFFIGGSSGGFVSEVLARRKLLR
jgi:hypothetical protein